MDEKVVKIPISQQQRMRNQYGEACVPRKNSNRWLQFPYASIFDGKEDLLKVEVMTLDKNHKVRILCELTISREDIMSALSQAVTIHR